MNFIGTHLSCCSGQSNWNERYEQQESMLNYMDDLGDVPIIYLGDFNAESPDDVDPNSQDPDNDLGTEPIEMVLNPNHVSASKIHRFVDVAEEMGTKDITYIACCNSRIDYIFVNQHFDDLILDSTTGDTKNGLLGSDHTSVDVNLDLSNYKIKLTHSNINISTANAFSNIKAHKQNIVTENLSDLPIERWKNEVKNDFENNIFEIYPQLKIEKDKFYSEGAIYSSMTGTGSTIYGIFKK